MAVNWVGSVNSDVYLETGTGLVDLPISLFCFFNKTSYPTGGVGFEHLITIGQTGGGNSRFEFLKLNIHGDGRVGAGSGAGLLNLQEAFTTDTYTLNAWHSAAAVFASDTSRTAYLDGVAGTTDTASADFRPTDPADVNTLIGTGYAATGFYGGFTDCMAHALIFPFALTPADVLTLHNSMDLAAVCASHGSVPTDPDLIYLYAKLLDKATATHVTYGPDPLTASGTFDSVSETCGTDPDIAFPDPCDDLAGYTDDDLPEEELACDIEWPFDDLRPRSIGIYPNHASLSGGMALTLNEPVQETDIGFWGLELGAVSLRTIRHVRKWREVQAVLNGRQGTCCVHIFDGKRAPWEVVGVDIIAEAVGDFAANATTGTIQVNSGAELEIGMHFSAGERLYRITDLTGPTSDPPRYGVTIWPKVRTAIDDGDPLEFSHPICRMRLETDDQMDVQLDLMRFANPTVRFVEDI